MTKILVVGDIGQPVYHVGDEAMTIATAAFFASRGAQVVLATRDEEHSARYIGAGAEGAYEYLPFLLFPWSPADRERTLEALEEYLREGTIPDPVDGGPSREQIRDFVSGVCAVDAIVISGGGNMNSRYGWLLYERAAFALVAEYRGIDLFISGQSLGPVLSETDAATLGRMLGAAKAVAVRESGSHAWCAHRELSALAGVDDATDYTPHSPEITLKYPQGVQLPELPERYMCLTINEVGEQQVRQLARLLDEVHTEHGLSTVFLGHMGDPDRIGADTGRGDADVHERIARAMDSPAVLVPITHTDAAVRIHTRAVLTITSRYHPAIFSLAAGIPTVALVPDAFTEMRLGGAMSQYGMGEFITPLGMLGTVLPGRLIASALTLPEAQLKRMRSRSEQLTKLLGQWREFMWASIIGESGCLPDNLTEIPQYEALAEPERSINHAIRRLFEKTSLTAGHEWALSDRMHSWEYVRRLEIEGKDREITALEQQLKEATASGGSLFKRFLGR